MSINPDTIPHYAQPTPEELDHMYHDPTPDEARQSCEHARACERLWHIFISPLSDRPDSQLAATLGCAECREYDYERL